MYYWAHLAVGHVDHAFVSPSPANMCESDASISGSSFDNSASRFDTSDASLC